MASIVQTLHIAQCKQMLHREGEIIPLVVQQDCDYSYSGTCTGPRMPIFVTKCLANKLRKLHVP